MSEAVPDVSEADLLATLADEFREGGLVVDTVPPSHGSPAQLVMAIVGSNDARPLQLNCYFMPDVSNPWVLQYFVTLPYSIVDGTADRITRFVCALNATLPVTGFEFAEATSGLAFRHTHAVSLHPLDPGVVAWSLSMANAAVANFGRLVEQVAGGGDVDEAIIELGAVIEGLTDGG